MSITVPIYPHINIKLTIKWIINSIIFGEKSLMKVYTANLRNLAFLVTMRTYSSRAFQHIAKFYNDPFVNRYSYNRCLLVLQVITEGSPLIIAEH